jgi:glutaredoxin-like YruB-family protein
MKVKVYSAAECPWCKKVKAFLTENKVKFTSIDVGKDQKAAEEMMKKSGQQGVPVIDIDGTILTGFDEKKLRKALKL